MSHEITISIVIVLGCLLLGLAVWTDMREHRIPNWLVLGLLMVGFEYQVLVNGSIGLIYAVGGISAGMALFIGFYIGRGMGAGDVKLMGAAGALLGPSGALIAGACSLVAGFILVIGGLKAAPFIRRYAAPGVIPELFVQKNNAIRVPYAPAIFVGSCIAMWYMGAFSTLALITK
jgi:prepilin peptidase CpaA